MKEAIEETESKDSANFVSVDYIEVYTPMGILSPLHSTKYKVAY